MASRKGWNIAALAPPSFKGGAPPAPHPAWLRSGASQKSPPSYAVGMRQTLYVHQSGVTWCNRYYRNIGSIMETKRSHAAGKVSVPVRASVSFPSELYQRLEEIARQKKVSVAWVVRDAAERYVSEHLPSPMARTQRTKR